MLSETQRAAQQLERELRHRLAKVASLLAQAQSQGLALQQRLEDLERQLGEERKSHEGTRALLATALAKMRKRPAHVALPPERRRSPPAN